jgi:mannitol/fructose-specific phosphotransferase system IIA component (Ntr-type)
MKDIRTRWDMEKLIESGNTSRKVLLQKMVKELTALGAIENDSTIFNELMDIKKSISALIKKG